MKIAVITDSGSGFSKKQANDLGVFYLPLQIMINDDMYLDGETISVTEIYDLLAKGEMPTTSMPPVGIMEEVFHQIKEEGYDEVIAIPLSSGLSSTSSIMQAVAKDLDLNLHIIEIYSTCHIQKYLVQEAVRLVGENRDVNEIVSTLTSCAEDSGSLIIPDDLQHLKRGGRLTPLAAALGGLLKIKPILQLNKGTDGKIDVFDKVRTMSKAMGKVADTVKAQGLDDTYEIAVLHSGSEESGLQLKALVEEAFPGVNVYFGVIGAVIAVHTGLGCVGVQFVRKVK